MNGIFYKTEPTALIVDGPTSFIIGKMMAKKIDFTELKQFMRMKTLLRVCHYVTPILQPIDEGVTTNNIVPLIDWLGFNGWRVHARTIREKGTSMSDLCAAMADEIGHSQHIVLLAGDADLTPMVAAVQKHGIRVTILNTVHTESQLVANSLRKQADNFVDFVDIYDEMEEMRDRG